MSSRKKETPPSRMIKQAPMSRGGKIPLKELFSKIYEKIASVEVPPEGSSEEFEALKSHLAGAIHQMDAIQKKIQEKERQKNKKARPKKAKEKQDKAKSSK